MKIELIFVLQVCVKRYDRFPLDTQKQVGRRELKDK